MPQSPYLSTDPQAGMAAAPPPAAPPKPTYLSTDPNAGLGGHGAGPGAPKPSTGGRGSGPGNEKLAASQPPPTGEFYPGGWKAAGQDAAGMVGGGLATLAATAALPEVAAVAGVTGVVKMLPMAARVARGAIGIAGAGAGGAGAAALEGEKLSGGEDSVAAAFKRQAEMEAWGLGTGWALSGLGRRVIASRVASKAKEWLTATRNLNLEDVKGIFSRSQDAIRSHAAQGAATKLARSKVTSGLGDAAAQFDEAGAQALGEARGASAAAKATKASGDLQQEALKQRWPKAEAEVAPPSRPPASGGPARYAHTQDGFGGPDIPMYEITDPTHPLAGSHVSAATLTEHGIPVPAHTPPPSMNPTAWATHAVEQVVSGPAQRSLDQLGQAVESSAESGPMVNTAAIKAKAQAMWGKTQPEALTEAVPQDIAGYLQNQSPEQIRAFMEKAGIPLEAEHPLPGVLGKVGELPDSVSFTDMHKMKRMLDDAIGWKPAGAIKAPARGQLKQITKGVRGQIRDAMAGHAPYDQATAAYRDASTLFGPQGLARKIQAAAKANPEALVNTLVKPSEPTKLQMLKEVLTHHAEEGGGEAGRQAGQEAWQQVQSTVMYKHLIQPGIEHFEASVAKMHPEFLHTLTGDPYARQVFDRLSTMSEAVKQAAARTEAAVAGHQAAASSARGRAWNAQARSSELKGEAAAIHRTGSQTDAQHAVEGVELQRQKAEAGRAVQEAKQPTAGERAFAASSMAKPASAAAEGSDIAYAAVSPLGSPRQIAGAARLVLRGPKVNDLIRWASLSPSGTQMFVRAVTGPAPGQAIAAMIRLYDWEHGEAAPKMAVSHQQGKAATPPPGPGR